MLLEGYECRVNIIPADALTANADRASAGMIFSNTIDMSRKLIDSGFTVAYFRQRLSHMHARTVENVLEIEVTCPGI